MIRAVFLSRTNVMETASLILVDIHLEMEKKNDSGQCKQELDSFRYTLIEVWKI